MVSSHYLYRNLSINGTPWAQILLGIGDGAFAAAGQLIARLNGTALALDCWVWLLTGQAVMLWSDSPGQWFQCGLVKALANAANLVDFYNVL